MSRIISNLSQVGHDYQALFCDLWGCLHNGKRPYPAAVAALQQFRQTGGKVCLMTNAPRPNRYVIEQLGRMGVPSDCWDLVVSSGDSAQDAMFSGTLGQKVWHIGPEKDEGFFTDIPDEWRDAPAITRVPLEDAEGIVCTGLFDDSTETPGDYRGRLMLARERGLTLLCANPDVVVDVEETRIWCAGAIAELYQELGGTSLYFGKPHPPIYDRARRLAGLADDARILAVGDGVHTDVKGAQQEGIDCLFVTGGLAADNLGPDAESPDPGLLNEWLSAQGAAPEFSIGRLR